MQRAQNAQMKYFNCTNTGYKFVFQTPDTISCIDFDIMPYYNGVKQEHCQIKYINKVISEKKYARLVLKYMYHERNVSMDNSDMDKQKVLSALNANAASIVALISKESGFKISHHFFFVHVSTNMKHTKC